jgi:hypothetical protein
MLPGALPLPKGASLADVSMHHAAASAAPPSLIDVRHMYARGGAPAFAPIAKVPSFVELNARASSPGGVKVAPVKSLAHVAPIVPTAARAVGVGVGSRFDPNDLVRKAEAHREAVQSALAAADASPAPEAGVTCANCRTQKTPLWRNGPLGPKTLCNACGVRFKLGKLPPPGGWPPGHVPPPAPPRKRPAHGDAQGGKSLKAGSSTLSKRVDETKKRGGGDANGHFGHITKKQRRKPRLAPSDEYVRHRFGAGASVLTDHDGAVLLMVLAGLYDH